MLLLSIVGVAVIAPFVYIIHDSLRLRKQVEVECEALLNYTKARREVILNAVSGSDQESGRVALEEALEGRVEAYREEGLADNYGDFVEWSNMLVRQHAERKEVESKIFQEEFLRK